MKRIIVTGLLATAGLFSYGQELDKIINTDEVRRIETILSADEMQGRRIFTPGIEKAAAFIADEFKSAGLELMNGANDFRQKFTVSKSGLTNATATLNGIVLNQESVKIYASKTDFTIDEESGYKMVRITYADGFYETVMSYMKAKRNLIILVDPGFANFFFKMNDFTELTDRSDFCKAFLLTSANPVTYSIEIKQATGLQNLCNIVGVIPGKSKKDEYVIFSGHYDHVGIGPSVGGDSIYNGANDDATGVTAVIMLAKYFMKINNNERTLIFVAFTGEEYGRFGSKFFSKQLDAAKVKCMFNIEMIGTETKWGKKSAYITGYKLSNLGKILGQNVEDTGFEFYPDPYTAFQLFYRSDNITLARLGIPAHTIMSSTIDYELNYHKPSDEIGTLDLENMTTIIKSIAVASRTIVAGTDTPSRINVRMLKSYQ